MPRKTKPTQDAIRFVSTRAPSDPSEADPAVPNAAYRAAVARIKALEHDPARAQESSELRERVLEWALDQRYPGRALCFSEDDARRALGVSHYKIRAALEVLEGLGRVLRRKHAKGTGTTGWGVLGAVAPRRTLAELLERVQQAPEPDPAGAAPKPGRRTAAEANAPLTCLTPKQREVCVSVGYLIAEFAPDARGDIGNVTADYLARTVDADGRRVSALEAEVAHMSDQRARARAERHGKRWRASDNAEARAKAVSAVRTLVRFAVSTDWFSLAGDAEATPELIETYAPEWHAPIQERRAWLDEQHAGVNASNHRRGLITLALFATRRHQTDWSSTDWVAVLRDIEQAHANGQVSDQTMSCVHTVWRRLPELQALESVDRPEDRRVSLVPRAAVDRLLNSVDRALRPEDLDFAGFVAADGRAYSSLVEGPYGLRRWVWYTAGNHVAVAADVTLPARVYEARYRRRKRRDAISRATLENRLRPLLLVAGWAAGPAMSRELLPATLAPCDWITRGTLLDLAEPMHLLAYRTWRNTQPTQLTTTSGHADKSDNGWRGLITAVRRYVRDVIFFAEMQSSGTEDAEALVRARRIEERVALMAREAKDRGEFERCTAINAAWRPDGGRWGLERLIGLRNLLVEDAEYAAGGLSWEEQLRQLREYAAMPDRTPAQREQKQKMLEGMHWRTPTWARSVACAAFIHFTTKLPLRERALRALRVEMISATDANGRVVAPWAPGSTVLVDVPGEWTKNRRPYVQAFVARDSAGKPTAERGAARWLLELMWGPGGAHQYYADLARNNVSANINVGFAFPKATNRGRSGRGNRTAPKSVQYANGGLSTLFRGCVLKHGQALGIDLDELRSIKGGLGVHTIRYLAGRYWCVVRNLLDYASDLLHHGDIQITKARYVGSDPGAVSHDIETDAP